MLGERGGNGLPHYLIDFDLTTVPTGNDVGPLTLAFESVVAEGLDEIMSNYEKESKAYIRLDRPQYEGQNIYLQERTQRPEPFYNPERDAFIASYLSEQQEFLSSQLRSIHQHQQTIADATASFRDTHILPEKEAFSALQGATLGNLQALELE